MPQLLVLEAADLLCQGWGGRKNQRFKSFGQKWSERLWNKTDETIFILLSPVAAHELNLFNEVAANQRNDEEFLLFRFVFPVVVFAVWLGSERLLESLLEAKKLLQ